VTDIAGEASGLYRRLLACFGPLQFGPGKLLVAAWADAVAKLHVSMLGDIPFDLLPVIAVVADLLAVSTDGQETSKVFETCKCLFEFSDALGQTTL
jgi:hypothetical protein